MEEKQYSVGINVLGGAGLSQAQHIALIAEAGWDAFFTGWGTGRTYLRIGSRTVRRSQPDVGSG